MNLSLFFFNFWDGPVSKKILTFLSLQAAYGSQLCFVLVLWLNFIFVIYFFCVGTIWNFITYLSCLVSFFHSALLILFIALSVSGIGHLQRGNSRLPTGFLPGSIGSATIKMTIYTTSLVHFWTTEANHYTVYMYMYIDQHVQSRVIYQTLLAIWEFIFV